MSHPRTVSKNSTYHSTMHSIEDPPFEESDPVNSRATTIESCQYDILDPEDSSAEKLAEFNDIMDWICKDSEMPSSQALRSITKKWNEKLLAPSNSSTPSYALS